MMETLTEPMVKPIWKNRNLRRSSWRTEVFRYLRITRSVKFYKLYLWFCDGTPSPSSSARLFFANSLSKDPSNFKLCSFVTLSLIEDKLRVDKEKCDVITKMHTLFDFRIDLPQNNFDTSATIRWFEKSWFLLLPRSETFYYLL